MLKGRTLRMRLPFTNSSWQKPITTFLMTVLCCDAASGFIRKYSIIVGSLLISSISTKPLRSASMSFRILGWV